MIDAASGEVKLIPCTKAGLTSAKCAQIFLEKVYPQWGTPKTILSDQDVRWVSAFWKSFHNALGTTLHMSTAYHPQSNGKIERMHAVLNSMMRQLIKENQTDWVSHLPLVEVAINSSRNASGFSPYELTRVFQPSLLLPNAKPAEDISAQELLERAKRRNNMARDILTKARIERTYYANRKRRPDHIPRKSENKSDLDQWYWVRTANWRTVPERSRSLCPPFDGPFRCLSYDKSNSTYVLDLPTRYTQRGIATKFHASQLKPYVESDKELFPGRVHDSIPIFPLDALENPQMDNSNAVVDLDKACVRYYTGWEWQGDSCFLIFNGFNSSTNRNLHKIRVKAGAYGHDNTFLTLRNFVATVTGESEDWRQLPREGGTVEKAAKPQHGKGKGVRDLNFAQREGTVLTTATFPYRKATVALTRTKGKRAQPKAAPPKAGTPPPSEKQPTHSTARRTRMASAKAEPRDGPKPQRSATSSTANVSTDSRAVFFAPSEECSNAPKTAGPATSPSDVSPTTTTATSSRFSMTATAASRRRPPTPPNPKPNPRKQEPTYRNFQPATSSSTMTSPQPKLPRSRCSKTKQEPGDAKNAADSSEIFRPCLKS